MVCKTVRDGSNPSVHLRAGVMAARRTLDPEIWFISCAVRERLASAVRARSLSGSAGTEEPAMLPFYLSSLLLVLSPIPGTEADYYNLEKSFSSVISFLF